MYHLLQSLAPDASEEGKAEESHSEDEDFNKLVDRRQSMNIDNVIGLDFERYNKMKPSQQVKMKIKNLAMEFLHSLDKEHASEEFTAICAETDTKTFTVAGYILNSAFSQDRNKWNEINSLVVDHLYVQEKKLSSGDLVER